MDNGSERKWQDTERVMQLFFSKGKRVSILIHVNPDGDAAGSALGMKKVLENMGHDCSVISPNAIPQFLKWMPGCASIVIYEDEPGRAASLIGSSEIIIALDFNNLRRIRHFENLVFLTGSFVLMIDHHPEPDDFADCAISDVSASSTAEIVYQFIKSENLLKYMDADAAACLFAGIVTDTGCFSYNSSDPGTFEIISELLTYGIDKNRIYSLLYDNFSSDRMRMLGYALYSKLEILPDLHTGYIWLTMEELGKFNFSVGDTEGFVNYPLSIKGIRFSAFFTEKEDHVKISFRSKGNFEVNTFAKSYFNGGGHTNAAGGESYRNMKDTLEYFLEILLENREKLSEYED
jgi:bifunctional oligoribonuclease and PAP phosphatase NrnA